MLVNEIEVDSHLSSLQEEVVEIGIYPHYWGVGVEIFGNSSEKITGIKEKMESLLLALLLQDPL